MIECTVQYFSPDNEVEVFVQNFSRVPCVGEKVQFSTKEKNGWINTIIRKVCSVLHCADGTAWLVIDDRLGTGRLMTED